MDPYNHTHLYFVHYCRFSENPIGCRTRLSQLRRKGPVSPSVPELYRKVPNEPWREVFRPRGPERRYRFKL